MEFYTLDSIASQIKEPTASEFIRVGLGIKDYKRGSSVKIQRSAEKTYTSARGVTQVKLRLADQKIKERFWMVLRKQSRMLMS